MGFGMPVVSTRHAGIPEVVRTGLDGFIGEEGDAESMAESIVKLARDQSLRAKMGRSAYERARDNFDFKHEGAALRKVAGLSRFDNEVLN
jgi:glycosyltransferase involved in cell wall biosynthesis